MKKHLSTIALVLVLICGLCVLLYPIVSDLINTQAQNRVVTIYSSTVSKEKDYSAEWQAVEEFNTRLAQNPDRFHLSDEELAEYNRLLNVNQIGVIGTITIPCIDVTLPVYHGISEGVLQVGVGHMEGTSLPADQPGTHVVLSGHRGLPSAKLFTNLDKVLIGDTFELSVLNQRFIYQVDQILTVLPDEVSALAIEPDQTYCTLITCTPYGVNSHRLLVRGYLVRSGGEAVLTADAEQIDPMVVAMLAAVPLLLLALLWTVMFLRRRSKKTRKER